MFYKGNKFYAQQFGPLWSFSLAKQLIRLKMPQKRLTRQSCRKDYATCTIICSHFTISKRTKEAPSLVLYFYSLFSQKLFFVSLIYKVTHYKRTKSDKAITNLMAINGNLLNLLLFGFNSGHLRHVPAKSGKNSIPYPGTKRSKN